MLQLVERPKKRSIAGASNITLEVTTVTPEIAQAWLDKNENNRKVSRRHVDAYARDMKSGKWVMTGEPIQFASDGRLLNGQHRLRACIDAGVPFQSVVAYNVPNDAQDRMDVGKSRNMSDVLSLSGYHTTHLLAATAKLILDIKATGGPMAGGGNVNWTHAEIMDCIRKHKALPASANFVNNVSPKGVIKSQLCFVHYVAAHMLNVPASADAFVAVFKTGVPAYKNDPAHKYRERMLRAKENRITANRSDAGRGLAHVWNLFSHKKNRRSAEVPEGLQD